MSIRIPTAVQWTAGGCVGCFALAGAALAFQPGPSHASAAGERPRATLAGVPVDGKSADEIREIAQALAARTTGYPLTIRLGKRSEKTTAAKLGASTDIEGAVNAALAAAEETGNLIDRIRERFQGVETTDVPLPVKLQEAGVTQALKRFSAKAGIEPRNARLTKVAGKFKSFPPVPGKELDSAALAQSVQSALEATAFRARLTESLSTEPDTSRWLKEQAPLPVEATTRRAEARIGLDSLKEITGTLASFSTSLGGSSRNRIHNIRLACTAIDGTVLLPGDVFSYNDIVGPRVPSAGYKEAPQIVRGKLQPGTGGGICQVSSTLYNSILLADLEIVRRRHHAFPVAYVPAGRDATVVDGAIDFRFKNRLEHPVAIDAKVAGSKVVVQVYGHPDDKREVQLVSSKVSRVRAGATTVSDRRLPRGRRVTVQAAKDGRRVTLSRVVKKDGEVVRREVVSRDYYRPFPGVVRVGTADPAPRRVPRTEPETSTASGDTPEGSTGGSEQE